MDSDIAALLAIDGIASGAIYVLIAIGLVLIFAVTRVIFVPFGDIAAFTALTLSALETQHAPGTIGLVAVLSVLASAAEAVSLLRHGHARSLPRAMLFYLVLPLAAAGIVWAASGTAWPMPVRIALSLILILPIAPLLDRLVFRPVADGSVLLLLTLSVALHFALAGLGLVFFGAEGVRTEKLTDYVLDMGDVSISGQTMLIVGAAALFSLLLYLFFGFTLTGKALHATAVNRTGAAAGGHPSEPGWHHRLPARLADGRRVWCADRSGRYDLLRFRLPARPVGVRGCDHRRVGQLPGHGAWRAAGGGCWEASPHSTAARSRKCWCSPC